MLEAIMRYEAGELTDQEYVIMFAELVRSGTAWDLQGCYGRAARDLIDAGVIDTDGTILIDLETMS